MKWFFVIVGVGTIAWIALVKIYNWGSSTTQLQTVDSSQAKTFANPQQDSIKAGYNDKDTIPKNALPLPAGAVNTKNVQPQQIIAYATTLIGTPYLYGSTDPEKGFDCSGFITYVFNHFDIAVPRSSIDFTNVGTEVSAAQARGGDLILFTGTDSTEHFVGHMGIVVSNSDTLRFIHSTSGKQRGVTITPLSKYYQSRYVKTVRVFN